MTGASPCPPGDFQILTHLLTVRFGPLPVATVERLRAGTAEDHERWTERLLAATSLDAVFLPPDDA